MKATNRKPLEFKADPQKPKQSQRENRQKDFLRFLAQGESIQDACAFVGVTRSCYEQWRNRHEDFPKAVEAARESHRQGVLCGFHTADAYARVLLDAIQRDEALPAALRYRAAKTMLSRRGKADWLPDPLPANAAPLAPYDDEHPESLHAEPGSAPEPPAKAGDEEAAAPDPAPRPVIVNAAAPAMPGTVTAAAGSTPQRQDGIPDKPYKVLQTESVANCLQNQQNSPIQPLYGAATEFSTNPDKTDPGKAGPALGAPTPPSTGAAASAVPSPSTPAPEVTLSQTWLSAHFLHGHESPKAFDKLLANHIHAYAPATPPEELLVFRITQKAWLLRRLETWERVIADSRVTKVREQHPNAAAPACIALSLLEAKETSQTRFYQRTAKLREQHEAALDRLTSRLETIQLRRETNRLRDQRANPFPARRSHLPFARLAGCDRDH